jgi:hypothetical protein
MRMKTGRVEGESGRGDGRVEEEEEDEQTAK